jgi:hypothetical protein
MMETKRKEIFKTTNASGKTLIIEQDIVSDSLYWIDIKDIDGKLIDTFPISDKQIKALYVNVWM